MKEKFIVIETTFPDLTSAKKLSRLLVKQKLAACVQFYEIHSNYSWQGKIVTDQEILIKIKTINLLYAEIEKIILQNCRYDNPQIISTLIYQGSKAYLDWIKNNVKNHK